MRTTAVCSLLCVLAAACHASTLSPQQIDDLHAHCQAHLASVGRGPVPRSENVGVRTPADPPGTPVVIYGASWCDACHIAAQYMTREQIPFVERDIEKEPAARAQANAALVAAGLRSDLHVLPVIDVRGTVLLGFDSCLVEQAWASP
ncbi:MAG TPA: glutaredoxin domain-containing protein [Polyangiaceae bacterium]|nr:glutaredoxin domain-containing protein [Polyangiaceae bacterium]